MNNVFNLRVLISFDKKNLKQNSKYFFLAGIFLLPSIPILASILLLIAACFGIFIKKENYFKDNWNKILSICGLLIIISSFIQNKIIDNSFPEIWDPNLSIFGTMNWIPFFFLFWCFQPFVNSSADRKNASLAMISGTFPVLISGFGQYFFNWTGPFKLLNGLIVWYQRPLEPDCILCGLSGLFNNANYASSWLILVWPFCIALVLEKSGDFFKKTISFSFLISVALAALLTYSRNAWTGLLVSLPLVIGAESLTWFLPIITFSIVLVLISSLKIFSGELQEFLRTYIIPEPIWTKIGQQFSFTGENADPSRLDMTKFALGYIKMAPFIGIGAASFSPIFESQTNFWRGHSHNLFIELAFSYGLPVTIILFATFSKLIIKSSKFIFTKNDRKLNKNHFERAWWSSLVYFLFTQFTDIQYFDGKISVIAWILLAGLKNIIEENNIKDLESYKL